MTISKFKISYILYFLIITCVFFTSCNKEPESFQEFANIPRTEVKVDTKDTTSRFSSEVMQSIDYIPLETTPESLFSVIDKLELLDKYFVILDKTTNAIYFFYKDGRYSHKISNKGLAPEKSYEEISKFFIDRENKRIVIRDNQRLKLIYYDYNGKKLNEKDWPFDLKDFNSLGQTQFFYMAYSKGIDSTDSRYQKHYTKNLLIGDTTFKIEKSYFKFDPQVTFPSDLYNVSNVFYTSGSSILFCDPYQYDIIKFSGKNPDQAFRLSFDEKEKLPKDYLTSLSLKNNRRKFLNDNPNTIWACTEAYMPDKNLLIFNLVSTKILHNIFVYSLKSNRYFRLENIYSGDKFSYLLPVFGNGIDGADNQYVYSNITADFMFKAINLAGKSKRINTNPVLKKFFDESNNMANPVITKIKFKLF